MRISLLRPIIALSLGLLTVPTRALDVDSGMDAIQLAQVWFGQEPGPQNQDPGARGWVRLRGIDLGKVPETREALLKLQAKGIKTCVFLRLSAADWKRKYLPEDLRESHEHGRKLGATYGDLVDAWEVDNEPDLGFVPESAERYTAFLKAHYLGLEEGYRMKVSSYSSGNPHNQQPITHNPNDPMMTNRPLVIMGSLGLPPGPWLERFAANDGFAYTDGFNYHYYGYADDFAGIYRQFEEAVTELSALQQPGGPASLRADIAHEKTARHQNGPQGRGPSTLSDPDPKSQTPDPNYNLIRKNLPVFLTEIGYGLLGKQARDTKEGRLRQWRWFKSVGEQLATLRPEAPMAFYLPPYLEYDTSEYGLTVPAGQKTEDGGRATEEWIAGGIKYSPGDFGAEKSEPWMRNIGKDIGGNQATPALAQWLAMRNRIEVGRGLRSAPDGGEETRRPTTNPEPITNNHDGSRAWSVSVPRPSPVVIDFLPGDGLSHVKRYNGSFVTGLTEDRGPMTDDGKAAKPPAPKSPAALRPPPSKQPRSEEFILQVRTQNGNLYEVYPTRQATSDWQRFLEPGDNFTMAFYGRAALPWRFIDNKPASLVVVMYPKQLPVTYEFRRSQLLRLGKSFNTEIAEKTMRYGQGKVVVYNFSDKPISGQLVLPEFASIQPNDANTRSTAHRSPPTVFLTLAPGERREIPVSITVPWKRYERIEVPITFVPEDTSIPSALYLTALIPDIGDMTARVVANLLAQGSEDRGQTTENGGQTNNQEPSTNNRSRIASRPRASEEAPMLEQTLGTDNQKPITHNLLFVQPGATAEQTSDGFAVTVSAFPPGKHQRIEVEIPWPDGLEFPADGFLSVEFRLR